MDRSGSAICHADDHLGGRDFDCSDALGKDQIERTAQQFEQRDDVNRIAPGRFIETMGGRRIFFIEEVSPDGSSVKNVFMSEQNGESEIIVRAASGEVRATDKGERYVVLKNGRRYDTSRTDDAAWRVTEFDTYEIRIGTRAEQAYISRDVETMTFEKLLDLDTSRAKAEIVWRLCWPLAAFNLALLAIPLSYTNPRAGRSMSLILAVLIFICTSTASRWPKAGSRLKRSIGSWLWWDSTDRWRL